MLGLVAGGLLVTVFVIAIWAQTWTTKWRTSEPRAGVGRSGLRWYEPWPQERDYPTRKIWRAAALSWVGVHGVLACMLLTTLWQMARKAWVATDVPATVEPSQTTRIDSRDSSETYLFEWDRSFHAAVSIRIVREHEHAYLITAVGASKDSAVRGRRDSVALSLAEWTELTRSLSQESFWRSPPLEIFPDGAMWTFERRSARGYRQAAWHSPERGGRDSVAYEVGVRLLRAAGLASEEVY